MPNKQNYFAHAGESLEMLAQSWGQAFANRTAACRAWPEWRRDHVDCYAEVLRLKMLRSEQEYHPHACRLGGR